VDNAIYDLNQKKVINTTDGSLFIYSSQGTTIFSKYRTYTDDGDFSGMVIYNLENGKQKTFVDYNYIYTYSMFK
jgi:hypothetical protein